MSSTMAVVRNGKIVGNDERTKEAQEKAKKEEKMESGLGKEAFLQLLIAQMQYQDPLEPMDNTEYVSQLATFSQLEATQNLEATIDKDMANSLVGKYVILDTDSGTVAGKVDYVMYEGGEILLAVNDGLYSIEDLDTVADSAYYEAFEMSNLFTSMIAMLPNAASLTIGDKDAVEEARAFYDAMNSYQQGFVNQDALKKLEELEARMKVLTGNSGSDSDSSGEKDDTEVKDG